MKIMSLVNSDLEVFVDDEDFFELSFYTWHLHKDGHARRGLDNAYLHKEIALKLNLIGEIDHSDRNKLNNQRWNLRLSTHTLTIVNRDKRKGNSSSQFKGVCWHKMNQTWTSYITIAKKQIFLGQFIREEDAARAYNEAALKHFGAFACINKI